jgi:ATP phosphoribosyltransferase regulatory subunit
MSAWVLPDQFADVLPAEARQIEEMRRVLLDTARSYGYELVLPPLMEYLESLLSGTGKSLDLKTFKTVDQHSGRSLGVRADMTPQVARIDAHLLNREGVVRLCYCGPVARTRAAHAHATREPMQLGAELFGHSGLEADIEVLEMVRAALSAVGVRALTVDLADARILKALFAWAGVNGARADALRAALSVKDTTQVHALTQDLSQTAVTALMALTQLFGGVEVLKKARAVLPGLPEVNQALDDLQTLIDGLGDAAVTLDLSDLRGQTYYTGIRFAIFAKEHQGGMPLELARGGRYDEVGAVFGRHRPAVGFSLDIKELVFAVPEQGAVAVIRAPWSDDPGLRQAVTRLRAQGEVVIGVLPGHEHTLNEFECDRELVHQDGTWLVRPLSNN